MNRRSNLAQRSAAYEHLAAAADYFNAVATELVGSPPATDESGRLVRPLRTRAFEYRRELQLQVVDALWTVAEDMATYLDADQVAAAPRGLRLPTLVRVTATVLADNLGADVDLEAWGSLLDWFYGVVTDERTDRLAEGADLVADILRSLGMSAAVEAGDVAA